MSRTVVVHPTADVLAAAAAARLITALTDIQADGRVPAVALTGGGVGIATLAAVAASPAQASVDWRRVDIYWGDERFVPVDDDDRNEKQARKALLDGLDVDLARVHPMPPADGRFGADVDAAAAAYAGELAQRDAPLDVVLLGMGPEGHVASVFPDSDAARSRATVVAVRNCPKPPPTRISLTLPAIRSAADVWLLVAGNAKADAVAAALGGAEEIDVPAAGAVGRERTLWLIDRTAATRLGVAPTAL
ncbi:MAG: 6-phosphogluconolactonase [Actinobacteria bacterium 69-20]|nr:6-phosphogluconolactonase [Actinomycetota bacterium]OJV30306.1 MAG: 6-phosphogluconolactonase [Actinobacteria bacterium 69-20]